MRTAATATGVAGYGAVHTTAGGFSTYHPPAYGYGGLCALPPAGRLVPYYHGGCYDCAGAVAAGAVVGVAAGAAVATAAARLRRWASTTPSMPAGRRWS